MERDLVMIRVSGTGYLAPVDLDIDPDPTRGRRLALGQFASRGMM
jgi:hypothetical protein